MIDFDRWFSRAVGSPDSESSPDPVGSTLAVLDPTARRERDALALTAGAPPAEPPFSAPAGASTPVGASDLDAARTASGGGQGLNMKTEQPGTADPIQNPDGSVTTERSITVTDPQLNGGRATNIPTVWGGRIVSDDEAVQNAAASGMAWPSFGSIDEAVQAAEQRSQDLGAGRATSVGGATVPPEVQNALPWRNRPVRGGPIDESGGLQYRQPLSQQPELPPDLPPDPDQGPHELIPPGAVSAPPIISPLAPNENPGVSVTASQPAPPQIEITQGGPPTPSAQWTPVETRPLPVAPPATQVVEQSVPWPQIPGLQPVLDAAGNVVAWVQGQAQAAGQQISENMAGNRAAVEQANIATGAPDAPSPLTSAINTVAQTAEPFIQPMADTPYITSRINEIQTQAAAELGRSPIDVRVTRDLGWRARHPDLAEEYDQLQDQLTMALMGQVGDMAGRGHVPEPKPRYDPRLAQEPVLPGMEPPRTKPNIPDVSDVPNRPPNLGDIPPSQVREPALPGMEAPYTRPSIPDVSEVPNRPPVLGDVPPSQIQTPQLPGMEPPAPRPIGEVAEEIGAGWRPQELSAAVQRQQQRASQAARVAEMNGALPPPSAMDWIKSVGYSSMIGPSTALVNTFGNALELAWNIPKEAVRAAVRGAPEEFVQEMKGAVTGLMRGSGAVFDALAGHPVSGSAVYPTLSERVEGPITRGAATALEAGGRLFSQAPDAFFRSIGEHMGRAREAAQIATAEVKAGALSEQDWTRRVNQLLSEVERHTAGDLTLSPDAVDQIMRAGETWADRLTLRGPMGPKGTALRDAINRVGPIGHLIVPFFQTPYQMSQRLGERIPGVGARMTTQPNRLDKVYDQAAGAVVMAGVTGLSMNGLVTGSGPSDPEQRQMLRSQGWQPNSTLVAGRWVPNNVWGVFGPLFDAAGESADWYRYQKKDATTGQQMADAVKRAGTIFQNQAYLRGVGDLINAIKNPEVGLQSYLGSTAARLLPYAATGRTIAGAMDPVERSPERSRDVGLTEATRQGLMMSVPGLRQELPAAQDSLGHPVENERSGAAAILPRNRQPKPDVTIQAFTDAGVDIGYPRNTLPIDGIDFELRPYEQRAWQRYRGEVLEKFTPGLTQRSWWSNPVARQAALNDLLQQANQAADEKVQKDIGAANLQRRVKEAMQKKKAS